MARVGAAEAVVNLTFDRSVSYEMTDVDDATGEGRTLDEVLEVRPEADLTALIDDYCRRHSISDAKCAGAQANIRNLLGRDWGCDDDRLQEVLEFPVRLDGQLTAIELHSYQDVVLEAARFCVRHATPPAGCANVIRIIEKKTQQLPAFQNSSHVEPLVVRSPALGRAYPVSQRVYVDLNRTENLRDDSVCAFFDNQPDPVMCVTLPQEHPVFFKANSLPVGYHMLYFAGESSAMENQTAEARSEALVAARPFLVVAPTIEIVQVDSGFSIDGSGTFIIATLRATSFNVIDPDYRVCILHNAVDIECFEPEKVDIESDSVDHGSETAPYDRSTVFRVPVFGASNGSHVITALLIENESSKMFARSAPFDFEMKIVPPILPLERDQTFLLDPDSVAKQNPAICPLELRLNNALSWLCVIWRHEWGYYSQNGEDGVLAFIFEHTGVKYHTYVEFGAENGQECNTRLLREEKGWKGLLMDGSNDDPSINLHAEWVSAENIMDLLAKYDMTGEVDLLSVDVDFNDYWIVSAMDMTLFSPRVIIVEVNSHIPPTEARSVQYRQGAGRSWDGLTDYFGASVRAFYRWGVRNGYSLVYCESHGVNCFLVRNDVLGADISQYLLPANIQTPPNFYGRGWSYPNVSLPENQWSWVE